MSRSPEAVLFSNTQRFGPVLRLLRQSGFEPGAVLARFDLTEAQLLDPRTRVPRDVVVQLTRAIAAALRDPEAIGVRAAAHLELTDFGLLGYLVRHSEHVLGALQRFARYSRLIADAADYRVEVKQGRVVFRAGLVGARPISAQGIDYGLASVLVAVRKLTQPPIAVLAARLSRPKPRDPKPFHAVFGVPVEFAAKHTEMVFDQRAAMLPAAAHDPQLLAILERQAHLTLAELPGFDSFVEQVRTLIAAGLGEGRSGCPHIAASLGVSERTLRRRLGEAGLSHRGLVDQVRRERALELIAGDRASVVEVARQVGFSDPSAFAAAFRRWTGRSPRTAKRARSQD